MNNDIEKGLTVDFTNGDKIGKCSGCFARLGASWAEADQVLYMFSSQMNRVLGEVRESYCYYCTMRLIDKCKDIVDKNYLEELKELKDRQ